MRFKNDGDTKIFALGGLGEVGKKYVLCNA